jgi:hypothetical protein
VAQRVAETLPKGRRISDAQLAEVNLEPHAFHGEWNDTIHPTDAVLMN